MANSTEMYSGMHSAKPSSRVLAPPGGGSSNIFGSSSASETAQPARRTPDNSQTHESSVTAQETQPGTTGKKYFHHAQSHAPFAQDSDKPAAVTVTASERARQQQRGCGDIFGQQTATTSAAHAPAPVAEARPVSRAQEFSERNRSGHGNILSSESTAASTSQRVGSAASHRERAGHGNLITGEMTDMQPIAITAQVKAEADRVANAKRELRTGTRVRQPPGGASSGLW